MIDLATTIARAQGLLRGGDIASAERTLAPALAAPTPSADVLLMMADVRRLQGRLNEAESFARRATSTAPSSGHASGRLAAILQVQQRYPEARTAYEEALRREPGLDAVRLNLVRCLIAMEAYTDAETQAAALATRNPNAMIFSLLSDARRLAGKSSEAIEAAEQAVKLAPTDRAALTARAKSLEAAEREEEAISAYRALAHAPLANQADAIALTRALYNADRAEEAKAELTEAAKRWPHDEQILSTLCRIRWVTGVGSAFAEPLQRALAERPDDLKLRTATAELLYRAERLDEAEQILRDGVARFPDEVGLISSLAVVMDNAGRPKEALAAFDDALRRRPGDESISKGRIVALLRLQRGDEALAALKPLREKRPDAQDLIAREALALRLLGDPRYQQLYDYERYVRPYVIDPPSGFASLEAFNADLAERLRALHGRAAHPLDQSLRNGTQTTEDLAKSRDPIISAFISALDAPISDYIAKLPNDSADPMGRRKGQGYRIWGCWSVRLRPGGFHVNHVHPEGWISSSYYVAVPKPEPGDDPRAGWIKFGEPDLPVPGCEPELFIEPAPGKLVLFPSYMWHGTVPFTHGERLTAPFDVVPT